MFKEKYKFYCCHLNDKQAISFVEFIIPFSKKIKIFHTGLYKKWK